MAIASIILGIIFIIGGIYCMSAPVNTFMSMMMFVAMLLLINGIYGIIRFFRRRSFVPEFVVSILAVIIGFVYIFRPGNTPGVGYMLGLDRFALFMVALWFLIKGCINVYFSVRTRFFNNRWIFGFITGILSVILGIYSFIYPNIGASTVGTLVGLWYIECGIELIALGSTVAVVQDAVQEIDRTVDEAMASAENYVNNELRAASEAAEAAKAARDAEIAEQKAAREAIPAEIKEVPAVETTEAPAAETAAEEALADTEKSE